MTVRGGATARPTLAGDEDAEADVDGDCGGCALTACEAGALVPPDADDAAALAGAEAAAAAGAETAGAFEATDETALVAAAGAVDALAGADGVDGADGADGATEGVEGVDGTGTGAGRGAGAGAGVGAGAGTETGGGATVTVGVVTTGVVTLGTVGVPSAAAVGTMAPAAATMKGTSVDLRTSNERAGAAPGSGRAATGYNHSMELPTDDRPWNLNVETCHVGLWRGYTTARFAARVGGEDDAGAVELSSSFSWRSARIPDSQEAKLAHYELVSRLKAQGWTPTGIGAEWYETQLSRPTLVEGDLPEPDEPARTADEAPQPASPPPTAAPAPRREVVLAASAPAAARTRSPWQLIALAGLLLAIALLVFVAVHGA